MAVVPGASFPIGINGMHIHDGYLYFSNSFAATIYKLKIDNNGYPSPGASVEKVAKVDSPFVDDLTTGPLKKNTIWAATNVGDSVVAVKLNGTSVVVDGSPQQLTVAGATSSAFGRTSNDTYILYVTTTGGLADPVNGTLTEGGEVIAIDTRHFSFR
ncbi:hypothetical protein V1509DRAFT_643775 [Lipomyces kononenkoae]